MALPTFLVYKYEIYDCSKIILFTTKSFGFSDGIRTSAL